MTRRHVHGSASSLPANERMASYNPFPGLPSPAPTGTSFAVRDRRFDALVADHPAFSMRFLSDHLSERNRLALVSMVTRDGCE